MINKRGTTRNVFLTKKLAIKIPILNYGWKNFLWGLLGNMQEVDFNTLQEPKLCPVIFSLPFGLLVIMPRCRILLDGEIDREELKEFCNINENFLLPCEFKEDSFGYLNGNLVCVDYGN